MANPLVLNLLLQSNEKRRTNSVAPQVINNFYRPETWDQMPLLIGASNSLCVFDQSVYFRCGAACTWTVPANAAKVQFQVWGAGAGAGAAVCCGTTPFGANGAYAIKIIDAVPGEQFCLFAGCAFCCHAQCTAQNTTCGQTSYVCSITGQSGKTGHMACALGGRSSLWCYIANVSSWHRNNSICRLSHPNNVANCGVCLCSTGTYVCQPSSMPMVWPPAPNVIETAQWGLADAGVPSWWGGTSLTTDNYGCICRFPIPGIFNSPWCCSGYMEGVSSGTCCGMACTPGMNQLGISPGQPPGGNCIPGLGGMFSHAMGGSTGLCGSIGMTGMVRVSWTTV